MDIKNVLDAAKKILDDIDSKKEREQIKKYFNKLLKNLSEIKPASKFMSGADDILKDLI